MEDKIVLPAGMSMGGADENGSDISIHQSAMQGHPTAYHLESHPFVYSLCEHFFAYTFGLFVLNFFIKWTMKMRIKV